MCVKGCTATAFAPLAPRADPHRGFAELCHQTALPAWTFSAQILLPRQLYMICFSTHSIRKLGCNYNLSLDIFVFRVNELLAVSQEQRVTKVTTYMNCPKHSRWLREPCTYSRPSSEGENEFGVD